jgi:hypothetical protein
LVVSLHHFGVDILRVTRRYTKVNAHALIENTATPRPRQRTTNLATVLYVAAAVRSRPRGIDRYIDYFGDRTLGGPSHRAVSGVSVREETAARRRRVS